jgi:2-polyprenyl-3-methyl-5-hydroxy-6-metoxy-1,4-benzoquinol methylase
VSGAGLADAPAASFRDPAGRLFIERGRVFRRMSAAAAGELEAFLATALARSLERDGKLAGTGFLEPEEAEALCPALGPGERLAEHDAVPFPSYPYEWPAEMLHAAAALTLELARGALGEGWGLKDASPYNVLFRGARPVFVDLLSFERRRPGDPSWLAEAQFARSFLLPLAVCRRFSLPPAQWLGIRRDGLEPEEVYGWLGRLERLRRPWLTLASVPAWLGKTREAEDSRLYRARTEADPAKARFILEHLYRRLERTLAGVAPRGKVQSAWSRYSKEHAHYPDPDFRAKEEFVADCVEALRPRRVLDVGANDGHFRRIAAMGGAGVVAIDSDPAVVGACWRTAAGRDLDILPLVVDLARPTPATGWRNRECRSFLDRAAGSFDLVLMLAVVHHLLVTERIPLDEVLDLCAGLTRREAVIEYVDPADPMFRRLTRGREDLHAGLSEQSFEAACRRHFEIVRKQPLAGCRRALYRLRKAG